MERTFRDELDGTGGGFGRYAGLTLRDIADRYDACLQDPSMRGVSAVLRIAHEQLDARGGLGTYPWMALTALGIALALLGTSFAVPQAFAEKAREFAAAVGVVAVLFGSISFSLRLARRKSLYQEEQIRDMALDTLRIIVSQPGFTPKPLDLTQRLTLQRLLKKTRRDEPKIADLLAA